ncbi:hypothetical protein AGOR_G00153780 [Albula goreensis]|uniref:Uncharacterized protein n=1 Tax=Albula goreensis TaxID=1534307 RepID=A0A8T3D744_9TELE|nr:hypothetical protein AGOR_G00153780 [Albula goreensis]
MTNTYHLLMHHILYFHKSALARHITGEKNRKTGHNFFKNHTKYNGLPLVRLSIELKSIQSPDKGQTDCLCCQCLIAMGRSLSTCFDKGMGFF